MGRGTRLTIDVIHYIRDHCEEMPPRLLSKKLHIPVPVIRGFLSREGLSCFRNGGKVRQKIDEAPFGHFNVNEYDNWVM